MLALGSAVLRAAGHDVRAPTLPGSASALTSRARKRRPLLPVVSTYVLSFIFLGIYWNNHHHTNRWVSLGLYGFVALMWLIPDRRIESRVR